MKFIDSCMNELNKAGCLAVKLQGDVYYSLDCIKLLPNIIFNMESFEELLIIPYCLNGTEIFELYEYKLSIQIVKEVNNKGNFFLKETGQNSLEDIPLEIIEILDNTYYEVVENDKTTFVNYLKRYVDYMLGKKPKILSELSLGNHEKKEMNKIFFELL